MGAGASVESGPKLIETMTTEEIADLVSEIGSSYEKYSIQV